MNHLDRYEPFLWQPFKMKDTEDYYSKENLFQYRLSKIKFFIGEKNGKEIILGLQTFYVNINGKEQANEEARDKTEKETDVKKMIYLLISKLSHRQIRQKESIFQKAVNISSECIFLHGILSDAIFQKKHITFRDVT